MTKRKFENFMSSMRHRELTDEQLRDVAEWAIFLCKDSDISSGLSLKSSRESCYYVFNRFVKIEEGLKELLDYCAKHIISPMDMISSDTISCKFEDVIIKYDSCSNIYKEYKGAINKLIGDYALTGYTMEIEFVKDDSMNLRPLFSYYNGERRILHRNTFDEAKQILCNTYLFWRWLWDMLNI